MNASAVAVVRDSRLTPDAARLILEVFARGAGQHEVSHTEFGILLNHQGGDRRVSRALSLAITVGWLRRFPGGRGHSDSFEFSPPENVRPKDRHPEFGIGKNLGTPNSVELNTDSPPEFGIAKSTVVVVERDVVVGERERAREVTYPLSEKVEATLEQYATVLNGCRGSLRDYLTARVPTHLQYGFIQSIAAWVKGTDRGVFQLPSGSRCPDDEITPTLATALNELLATNEKGMKRPEGDPGNLRTKINVILKQRGDRGRDIGGTSPKAGSGSSQGGGVNPIAGDKSRRRGGPA